MAALFLWGDFGWRLKALGYLALIITGKAISLDAFPIAQPS